MRLTYHFFQVFWVAFCAVSMGLMTRMLLGLSVNLIWIDAFVFCGTLFGYHCTHPYIGYRVVAWTAGVLGGVLYLVTFWQNPFGWGLHTLALFPVVFWLAYYGFERPGQVGLRAHPIAKPFTVALSWAWVTVGLAAIEVPGLFLMSVGIERAAFIFALALAYDLSDMQYDQVTGLQTWTRRLGVKKSFALINSALGVSGAFVLLNFGLGTYDFSTVLMLSISLAVSSFWLREVLLTMRWIPWQKTLIDGLMMLQFVLVFLVKTYPT